MNEINDSKEKYMYFTDSLILSAFEHSKQVNTQEIQSEIEPLKALISEKFKTDLNKKLESIELKPEKANQTKAYQALLQRDYAQGAYMFSQLYKKNKNNIEYIKHLSSCLLYLNKPKVIKKYFLKTLKKHIKDTEILKIVGGTYFSIPEDFEKAIPYYEKLIKEIKDDYSLYYQLSFLYERVYQNKKLDIQIKYARKALELAPYNNLVRAFLAKLYYRAGEKDKTYEHFEKMMSNNPTPEQQVLYSRIFMQEGELEKGYDLYKIRFQTSNVAYPKELTDKTRWSGKEDLSNSTVIVHYEQGFGDSIMFVRYIPQLAKIAKKIILVVQKNIIPILKSSGYDKYCEILSHEADINPTIELADSNSSVMYTGASGMSRIPHDYHIPMMDLPYLFKESPDKMFEAKGYLTVDKKKLESFKKKYINNNNKFKIGISYHGTKQSNSTYRDIPVKEFLPLLNLKDVELYSFQADEYAKELDDLPDNVQIYNLGKEFKNFEDTACAIECMDLIISTDNVVMNLAGALGKKTFALFNIYPESRWYKTEGNDIGWYKSVKPFRVKTFNDWETLLLDVKSQIEKDYNL